MPANDYPWPYDVLELPEDARDLSNVKRAYARILKTIDQSTETERFQSLRQAYSEARFMAENGPPPVAFGQEVLIAPDQMLDHAPEVTPETVPEEAPEQPDPIDESPKTEDAAEMPPLEGPDQPDPQELSFEPDWDRYAVLSGELTRLMAARDYDVDAWMDILSDPVLDFSETSSAAEICILDGLRTLQDQSNLFRPAPNEDWLRLIENRFGWITDGLRFERSFPGDLYIRDVFNACHPGTDEVLMAQTVDRGTAPPKLAFYLTWWFILVAYTVFVVLSSL